MQFPQTYDLFGLWLPDYSTPEAKAAREEFLPTHMSSPMLAQPDIIRTS